MSKIEKRINFNAVKLSIASPEQILSWSHGEVLKPETINYRTQKPEKDGLFCEKIFGPTKDWECYCGKYKRIRYKGVICDKCGVEVTRSIVRRERMGHIKLSVPVTHIWFLRGAEGAIGLVLDLSIKDLERVAYFANYIITEVNEEAKEKSIERINTEFKAKKKQLQKENKDKVSNIEEKVSKKKKNNLKKELSKEIEELESLHEAAKKELETIKPLQIISDAKYRELSIKYGEVFKAGIGAEAIYELLKKFDLEKAVKELKEEAHNSHGQKKKRALRRLRLIEGLYNSNVCSEYMIMTVLPVIPPDLRPMVQLDGGRFAASDLNDLYRRIINRNNRLKRLLDMDAPEVICRNEKRMLQEAVDALIDSSARRDKSVTGPGARRKLRSLADMLKGKQGRFRQNLLGKRVDYSGRSVIVVGPELKLYQCGLPKIMALELFKPFVMSQLIIKGIAHNVKSAGRMIERGKTEVWDILEEVIKDKYVLLNRAPTLHRLGIQAFKPVLIEGKAIQIHPLVCSAFNADFDGDQMAVHVPLSKIAQREAGEIMLSSKNLLKPASGNPVVNPTQDMVLGCYYLTQIRDGLNGEGKFFSYPEEAVCSFYLGNIDLCAKIKVKIGENILETTVGRIFFNEVLPSDIGFYNELANSKALASIISQTFERLGEEKTAELVDKIKKLGFSFVTYSGVSIASDDIEIPISKEKILEEAEEKVSKIDKQFSQGLITDEERYLKTIELWQDVSNIIKKEMEKGMNPHKSVAMMIDSGARGNVEQLNQMGGMKGVVQSPTGKIIELPIRSNYKEGFSVLEYFISSHGARKGLSDTALRTSDSGYLTRRLVDVSQDIIITEKDCQSKEGIVISKEDEKSSEEFSKRIIGRVVLENIVDLKTGEVLVKKGNLITDDIFEKIDQANISEIKIRSVLKCESKWGVCQKCYGIDLARGRLVNLGEAVGVMAAQSIGEPGTQLTMRTFHTGGIAGIDITQGLPRVEELFEARAPKGQAIISEMEGEVNIKKKGNKWIIQVISENQKQNEYDIKGYKLKVKDNDEISSKDILATKEGKRPIKAKENGKVKTSRDKLIVLIEKERKEYEVPRQMGLMVANGDKVKKGQRLTEGSLNLQDLLKLSGEEAVHKYIISEVQKIYTSQGQEINNKHIEVIVRQMFSRVRIEEPGDTNFVSGEITSKTRFLEENEKIKEKKGQLAKASNLLLSITKVSLSTDSFLSAASFQETSRVLIRAATKGQIDELKGLKENVIIGKLIPVGTGFRELTQN